MKVMVVGSTGALGVPVVRQLVAGGHEVVGLTRSAEKAGTLEGLGARAALGDVFDPDRMKAVMTEAQPDAVVQLLNALPKRGPLRLSELEGTNRLRTEGTANVLAAALSAGARRFVAESMIFGYGYGARRPVTEEDRFGAQTSIAQIDAALDALVSLERQVLDASREGAIEGVVLRLGLFYGPGVGSTDFMRSLLRRRLMVLPGGGRGLGSWIQVEDGAAAVAAALERAPAGAVYNVVDDEPVSMADFVGELSGTLGLPRARSIPRWMARLGGPYGVMVANARLAVSNRKIKDEIGWEPRYPTYREGVRSLL